MSVLGFTGLAQLQPGSDDYQFLQTRLVRGRNALAWALREAIEGAA